MNSTRSTARIHVLALIMDDDFLTSMYDVQKLTREDIDMIPPDWIVEVKVTVKKRRLVFDDIPPLREMVTV